jgi:predicted nucleic acid-binding protein
MPWRVTVGDFIHDSGGTLAVARDQQPGIIPARRPRRAYGFVLTLYPDERTCGIWAAVVDQCRRAERPIQNADAWIAASARRWGCPPATVDFKDYDAIEDLDVVTTR